MPTAVAVDVGRARSQRWAGVVFALVVAIAFPFILYEGRDQWFFFDDWDFLAVRDASNLDDLLRPHNEHWSTMPILVYRALYHVFGLHHYWPYQVCLVTLHLAAAVLLWIVMRRAHVHPWIATAAASLFVLLGSGRQNIEFAFQIGFTGSLTFGLAFLVLTDHDGRLDRRDALGVAFGLVALMCSGIGVIMVGVVGVAALLRRGLPVAVSLVGGLALVYLLWFIAYGDDATTDAGASASDVTSFSRTLLANAFARMGQVYGSGIVLASVLLIGVTLTLAGAATGKSRKSVACTVALALGAVGFAVTTAWGRANAFAGNLPTESRYVHLVAAMTLPAIALGATAIARWWRPFAVATVALLLVGIPGNIDALSPSGRERNALGIGVRPVLLTIPRLQSARETSRGVHPFPWTAREVTVGWLLDADAAGRLPDPGQVEPALAGRALLALSLEQLDRVAHRPCRDLAPGAAVTLRTGHEIALPNGGATILRIVAGHRMGAVQYPSFGTLGGTLRVALGPIKVRVLPALDGAVVRVCT